MRRTGLIVTAAVAVCCLLLSVVAASRLTFGWPGGEPAADVGESGALVWIGLVVAGTAAACFYRIWTIRPCGV